MSTITLYLLHMKPILVKSLAYIFSGHSVGVWIYVTKCLFFERLAEWQQSGRQVTMVAVAATSGFRQRCVCWPHFTPQKPPSPALIPVAEPKFIAPPPNVYPKYLLPLPLSSSNFVHGCCHAFTPGRVASIANSKALLLGGNSDWWWCCKKQHKTTHCQRQHLDPLWLLLS